MAIGPLDSFVFPGVLTRTLTEPPTATAAGSLRYPAIIGVGREEFRTEGYELIRGSSAISDNVIVGEDVETNGQGNTVDGVETVFQVKNFPIVTGDGNGTPSETPREVIVQVDGERVPVTKVEGIDGKVTVSSAPEEGSQVLVNYYFKRRDSYNETEDVSVQADGSATQFKVSNSRIVKGDNSGTSAVTSDIGNSVSAFINGSVVTVPVISVTVGGLAVEIKELNGGEGTFTLASAPTGGDQVLVSYFSNDFQNTFDILPATEVSNIVRVGYDPGRTDFVETRDYVLSGRNEIHWGNSTAIEPGITTASTTEFGEEQVSSTLIDNRLYLQEISDGADGIEVEFTLPYTPVKGDGTGTPIEDPTNGTESASYDDIRVYTGVDLDSATEATVIKVDGKVITLAVAPTSGHLVFSSFYMNRLQDDTWTVANKVAGGVGTGTYTVVGLNYGNVRQIEYDVGSSTSTATFLDQGTTSWDGVAGSSSNAYINPSKIHGTETVTVTVDASGDFVVTSTDTNATGSGTSNTGSVGQTYIDPITGFTFALASATAGTLIFEVKLTHDVVADFGRGIPGTRYLVTTTEGVSIEDTALIKTYNLNTDDEPAVSDVYYVTFDQAKTDYSTKYVANFSDVLKLFGPLAQDNPIVIAANLAFNNGAQALAVKQIEKAPGENDATVSAYIDAIDEFDEPLDNGTRPSLIQPITTDDQVISYLKNSNAIQSSVRMRNERTSYFGFSVGTTPETVIARVKTLETELLTAVYPDGGVIDITDANGNDQEVLVGGEMVAVALSGRDVSPIADIATPLTNVNIIGFKRLNRKLDTVTANQIATAGTTVLENRAGTTKVLMALTTDLTGTLTRDPRIVEVKHFVQKGTRDVLNPFIGKKFLGSLAGDVETTLNNYLASLKQAELIADFKGVSAKRNEQDATTLDVEAFYAPVHGLNWIVVTHNISSVL